MWSLFVADALVLLRAAVENSARFGVAFEPRVTTLELAAALHSTYAVTTSCVLCQLHAPPFRAPVSALRERLI